MIQFDLLCVSDITGGQKQNKESCVQPHYDYDFLALAVTPHKGTVHQSQNHHLTFMAAQMFFVFISSN